MSAEKEDPHLSMVRVVFIIEKSCYDATAEHVNIVGSTECFGGWDVKKAKKTGYTGLNGWILEEFFPPFSFVEFQLALMRYPTRDFLYDGGDLSPTLVHRETEWVRRLNITDVSIRIHMTYGQSEVKVIESMSLLTRNGKPVCICEEPMSDIHFGQYTPVPIGWDFLETDANMTCDQFDRVEQSASDGRMFTFIRQSLKEQRFKEECQRIQREATERARRLKEESDQKGGITARKSVACQVETTDDDGDDDKPTKILKETRTQTDRLDTAEDRNMKLDVNQNIVQKIVEEQDHANTKTDTHVGKENVGGWRRLLKFAVPVGLGIGATAAAVYIWNKWK